MNTVHSRLRMHLDPGKLVITRKSQVITVVLGSCVAVTMFHSESGLAAICHAMLSEPRHRKGHHSHKPWPPMSSDQSFRYISHAIPSMREAYQRAGISGSAIEIKMFGGANVIGTIEQNRGAYGIGSANVEIAHRLLIQANLKVIAENTGGQYGRKILFDTSTGEVRHKYLPRDIPVSNL